MVDLRRVAAIAISTTLLWAGCTERLDLAIQLQSFQVTGLRSCPKPGAPEADCTPDVPGGSKLQPLPYVSGASCSGSCEDGEQCIGGRCSRCYRVDVAAIGNDGKPSAYTGPLRLDVTPGFVSPATTGFQMTEGTALGVDVCIDRVSGPAHIWVEHDGVAVRPADVRYGQCNDGVDNDGNGLVDLADPGCQDATDNLEAPVTGAAGVSDGLWFDSPTIRQMQKGDLIRTSPLEGQQVEIEKGAMVASNVTGNGFYVTDLDDAGLPMPFASVFVFTFSAPTGVSLGDFVCYAAGGVQEHAGHTQIVFPSYRALTPRELLGPMVAALLGAPSVTAGALEAAGIDAASGAKLLAGRPYDTVDLATVRRVLGLGQCDAAGPATLNLLRKLATRYPACVEHARLTDPQNQLPSTIAPEDRAVFGADLLAQLCALAPPGCERAPGPALFRALGVDALGADLTDALVVEDPSSFQTYIQNVYANSLLLESHESGLITVRDIAVSTRFVACDRNGNGRIDGSDETTCRNDCRVEPLCTDLEGYFEFGQWSYVAAGKKKMGASVVLARRFAPLDIDFIGQDDQNGLCTLEKTPLGFLQYLCPERTLAALAGSVRHVYLCGSSGNESTCDLQFWILDPRFDADVTMPPDLDQDGDGATPAAGDCNDNNPGIGPGSPECAPGPADPCED